MEVVTAVLKEDPGEMAFRRKRNQGPQAIQPQLAQKPVIDKSLYDPGQDPGYRFGKIVNKQHSLYLDQYLILLYRMPGGYAHRPYRFH